MSRSPSDKSESYAVVEGAAPALVAPGTYDLRFKHWETLLMFGCAPKLALWFTIIEMGSPYFDQVQLARYYNVKRIMGKPRKYGRFAVGPRSDALTEYGRLFSVKVRPDRIAFSRLEGVIVRGRVRTVTRASDQREIPECLRYSVLDELVEVKRVNS